MRPIIDAHLDLAMNVVYYDRDILMSVDEINDAEADMSDVKCRGGATLSLPELREAGVAICFATLLARSGPLHSRQDKYFRSDLDFHTRQGAWACNQGQLALYRLLQQEGEITILKTVADVDAHWQSWNAASSSGNHPIGVVLTMEGADSVLSPRDCLNWFEAGVRAIGPAHYGHSHFAAGTGVDGPLTPSGRELLQQMRACGMVLEATHLSDHSMQDALELWDGPVWASHHNCRRLVPWDRQLSDDQITALVKRDAVIGAACDAIMLDAAFAKDQNQKITVTMDAIVDHIDHVCQLAGSTRHVGIGTDLDGGYGNEQTPVDLKRYRDLRRLESILADRGYSESDIDAVFFDNWLRLLRSALPAN